MASTPASPSATEQLAFLIPVKSFQAAKARLAGALDDEQRRNLARALADGVVASLRTRSVAVVCDDSEVARWAEEHGVTVLFEPGRGLNPAVRSGVEALAAAGSTQVCVVHADLAFPEELATIEAGPGALLVPDRRSDGTNVLRVPTGGTFEFSYGPGSFRRHLAEADRLGLSVEVWSPSPLGIDVDVADDLELAEVQTRLWGPEGPHRTSSR
jgi:2-phospho-L-lactate/phosphoenolpyruvate guanylyltransferase